MRRHPIADRQTQTDLELEPRRLKRSGVLATPTVRELEVLELIGFGYSNAEIGKRLHLGEETIKTYVRRLLVKLDCPNRAGAVGVGYRSGLLGIPDSSVSRSPSLSSTTTSAGEPKR